MSFPVAQAMADGFSMKDHLSGAASQSAAPGNTPTVSNIKRANWKRLALVTLPPTLLVVGFILLVGLWTSLQTRQELRDELQMCSVIVYESTCPDWLRSAGSRWAIAGWSVFQRPVSLTWIVGDDEHFSAIVVPLGLKTFREIVLRGGRIGDTTLACLSDTTQLEYLDLSRTGVTDLGLRYLTGLTNLDELNLSFTQITDAGLIHVSKLSKLRTLNLDSTAITDAGLVQLRTLSQLNTLSLADTNVTDGGLKDIAALTSLGFLDLSETQVSSAGFARLKSLLPQTRIGVKRWADRHGGFRVQTLP